MKPLLKCLCMVWALSLSLAASAWPDKPLKLVVPFPPGGMGDNVARVFSDRLAARLGQPVLVDNRGGAAGNIGAALVAQAGADGHTFLLAATNNLVINQFLYPTPFDPLKAFDPVTILVDVPLAVFTRASIPANTVAEFAEYARRHPGRVNYGSPGAGTTLHLFTEILNRDRRMGMAHVPYKGLAPAINALLAGDVQLLAMGAGAGAPHVQSGRLKPLAVASDRRLPEFPDAQSRSEAGLPELGSSNWWAVAAPAGTPTAHIQKLRAALVAVMEEAPIRARLAQLGAIPVGTTPEAMASQLQREAAFYSQTIQAIGLKLE